MIKKIIFIFCAIIINVAYAQKCMQRIPEELRYVSAEYKKIQKDPILPLSDINPYVYSYQYKSVNETPLGATCYDLQSNSSIQNRIYLYPNGNIGAVWTYSNQTYNFSDRGSGYNYYSGSSWNVSPSTRLESVRCGWASYIPYGSAGECVISHNGSNGLIVLRRDTCNIGTFTETTLIGPTGTLGYNALLWPRAISSGDNIYIIACTDQASAPPPHNYYQGLALALVFYKSTDGGDTWSSPIILPGMDSASIVGINNIGFEGDSYAWAAAKGDTIAFVVGNSWSDIFVMKSFDGGITWSKIFVFDFPDILTEPTPIIPTNDGSLAVALDSNGNAHVVFGFSFVSDDLFSDETSSYYPYTDGLIYWNETKGVLDTSNLVNYNDSTLFVASMYDYDNNASIDFPENVSGFPFGTYVLSLTSMPQIHIDNNNDIYVTYSSCVEPLYTSEPYAQMYRHLYAIKSLDGGITWSSPTDLTSDYIHNNDECVFGSLSYTSDSCLHIVYQADEEPGMAIKGDEDYFTDNTILYLKVPKSEIGLGPLTRISKQDYKNSDFVLYPVPATDILNISLPPEFTGTINYNIVNELGQIEISSHVENNPGETTDFNIDISGLNKGIYYIYFLNKNEKYGSSFIKL